MKVTNNHELGFKMIYELDRVFDEMDHHEESECDGGKCTKCGWRCEFAESHIQYSSLNGCSYINNKYDVWIDEEEGEICYKLKKDEFASIYNEKELILMKELNNLNSIQDTYNFLYVVIMNDRYIEVTRGGHTLNVNEIRNIIIALNEGEFHLSFSLKSCIGHTVDYQEKNIYSFNGFETKYNKHLQKYIFEKVHLIVNV